MAAQVHHPAAPGALVAPAVVGQRGQVGQAAHDPPEALAPVERSVRRTRRWRRPAPGPAAYRTWRAAG